MKIVRILSAALLAVLLAVALAACQKKVESTADSNVEQAPPSDQMASGNVETTPAPDQSATQPPATTTTKAAKKPASTKGTSSGSKGSTAAYATNDNTVEIPVGTVLDVTLVTPVDTRTSNVGDKIEAKLTAPLVHDGVTIANQDAVVRGEVTALQRASRSKSEENRASVILTFTSLETVDGEKALHATVTNSEGKLVAKSTGTRDKLIIGGSTVAGAIIGKVAGKDTKSTVIGAMGGAVLGTGAVLASKGHELEVPAGSKVTLRVDEPITVVSK